MAKTLMISNEVYDELKGMKGNKSFSETIKDLISRRKGKGSDLYKYVGVLEKDREYDEIKKGLDKRWKTWSKKYA